MRGKQLAQEDLLSNSRSGLDIGIHGSLEGQVVRISRAPPEFDLPRQLSQKTNEERRQFLFVTLGATGLNQPARKCQQRLKNRAVS